jgi:hypothetical protein
MLLLLFLKWGILLRRRRSRRRVLLLIESSDGGKNVDKIVALHFGGFATVGVGELGGVIGRGPFLEGGDGWEGPILVEGAE